MKIIAINRRALHKYKIETKYEAGIVLKGKEVKSLRAHQIDITNSFAKIDNNELFLYNCYIAPFDKSGEKISPSRVKKLLMHKDEIKKLLGKLEKEKYLLIPLKVYFNNRGYAKVELGLGKVKKKYDTREEKKKLAQRRLIKRQFKAVSVSI